MRYAIVIEAAGSNSNNDVAEALEKRHVRRLCSGPT